jgi:hypothetical protein
LGGARGSGDSSVVLADRFDCRSRQAARGPSRPRVMNPRIHDGSSSSVREHSRRANKRRKPGLGGKAGGPVAGSLQTERALRKQRSLLGALVDGRRSEPGKPLSLARGWGKRFWFLERGSGQQTPGTRGARQGASEASAVNLAAVEKTATTGSAARSGARPSSEMSERL